ncbi:MAG: alcohol dehydrogenase catalytic domain-containing protein [Planctomycetota bacterium]|jgi:threonine dehydrogenase-like Zn-dependent dehydrogenase|nr:alcohol dehydrogenase catalytic domain-containing protein [Planctomycetota bacterium]
MRALVFYEFREGCVEIREVPRPKAGPDDVILRVKAAAICGSDVERIHCRSTSTTTPVIIGHEFSGVVEETGAGVRRWRPGDRVVSENTGHVCGECYACSTGKFLNCPARKVLGARMDGGFAEFVRIPGEVLRLYPQALRRLPDNLSFEEGAILEPSANAYYAIIQEGGLQLGQNVVIFGPGAIGIFAVAWAKLAGAAQIVLVGGSDNRLEFGRQLGAHHVVNYRRAESVAGEVEKAIGKNQADLVLDIASGGRVLADAIAVARPLAKIVKVGWSGEHPMNLDPAMRKGLEIIGHLGYDNTTWDRVIRLAALGRLDYRQFISAVFPLDHWPEAFRGMEEKRLLKAVFNSF